MGVNESGRELQKSEGERMSEAENESGRGVSE